MQHNSKTENGFRLHCTSSGRSLATQIASELSLELYPVHREVFSDGELFVRYNESVRGQVVVLVSKINMPYEHLMEMMLAIDAARRSSAKEVIVVIPYLAHSRQERRDGERTSVSARMVADMIQMVGADRVITLDLHNNAIEGFYKVPLDALSSIRLFVDHMQSLRLDALCLCSPDFGGIKRIKQYKKYFESADIAVINKERLKANQIAHMEIIGDVKDRNVILIDDMIDTAGTLCAAANLLMEQGALTVQAYCTHGILSGEAVKRIEDSGIRKIYISDTVREAVESSKIEVVPCAPLLARRSLY
jgi:ribose-phosphate pyrophosphokinase